jgi:hypothetical protein
VWCALSTFGFCVTEEQAEAMKKSLPNLSCTDDQNDDAVPDDDATPAPDDDAAPDNDDKVPDDYWKCLTEGKDETGCGSAGCTWCVSTFVVVVVVVVVF